MAGRSNAGRSGGSEGAGGKGGGGRSGPPERRVVSPVKGGGWRVDKPGGRRASATASTKKEATEAAKRIVRNAGGGEVTYRGVAGNAVDSRTVRRPTFPLRFTSDRLRELVRMVADREGISQNQLLEEAAEHEVISRGALLADELEATAAQLRSMTGPATAELLDASIADFVEGEALPDPVRPRRIEPVSQPVKLLTSKIGAVAAFRRG